MLKLDFFVLLVMIDAIKFLQGRVEFGEKGKRRNFGGTEVLVLQYKSENYTDYFSSGSNLKLYRIGLYKEHGLNLTNDTNLWPSKC